jgi:hypothetical protein
MRSLSRRDFVLGYPVAAAFAFSRTGVVELRKELAKKDLAIARAGGTKILILPFDSPRLERQFPLDPLGAIGKEVLDISWTAASGNVVFLTRERESRFSSLSVIAPNGKALWPVRTMPLQPVAAPQLSPDGTCVAFMTRHESHFGLWHLGPKGPPDEIARRLIAGDPGRISGTVGWSPDGDRNVVGWNNRIEICSVGHPQITTIGSGYNPAWSPDGNWISFQASDYHLVAVKSDGSNSEVFRSSRRVSGKPSSVWSPGSEYLLCNEEGSGHSGPTSHVVLYRRADHASITLWDNLAVGIFDAGIIRNWQKWSMNLAAV